MTQGELPFCLRLEKKCIFKFFQSLKDFFCPSNKRSRTSFLQRQNGTFEEQPSSSGQPSILQSLGKQPLGVVFLKTSKDHVYVATVLTKSNGFLLEPSISNFSLWGAEGVDILRPTVSKPSCQMSSYCGGKWLPAVYSSIKYKPIFKQNKKPPLGIFDAQVKVSTWCCVCKCCNPADRSAVTLPRTPAPFVLEDTSDTLGWKHETWIKVKGNPLLTKRYWEGVEFNFLDSLKGIEMYYSMYVAFILHLFQIFHALSTFAPAFGSDVGRK